MMRPSLLALGLATAVCVARAAPAPPEGPRQIRLAPQSSAKKVAAFRYRLLPDPRDITRGNAAPLWRLAGDGFLESKHKMTNQEFDWGGQTPLKNLPRNEVRALLARYTALLRLARLAACRDHCDWDIPPITFQSIQEYLPLGWTVFQNCRFIASLLCIQYRLQLVEGRFEDAAETLQTGFALARHLCEGDTLIPILVGIAIDAMMFVRVEEWMQTPGSPNLYWALTALPQPRRNLRRCLEYEMNSLYRSFPRLRRLQREALTVREAERLVDEIVDSVSKMIGDSPKGTDDVKKQLAAIRDAARYSQARKHLLDRGRSAKEVDAMPKSQVVLLWYIDQYDRVWEKVFEALTVPTWQARPLMEVALQEFRSSENIFLTLLAIEKTWMASLRFESQLAGLRCAEALRLFAAKHEGKPPAKWSDNTEVPLPIDPLTGKGFDDFYRVIDGRGILELPPPPPPGTPASLGRRYVLAPR